MQLSSLPTYTLRVLLTALCLFTTTAQAREEPPELATFMGELQRLTHKLILSTTAQNTELANFYLYESLEILNEIQEQVPEYEDIPVAVHLDRLALPAYEPLKDLLQESEQVSADDWNNATDAIIDSCNACHRATRFEFIRIQRNNHNPFAQDFDK